MARSPEEKKRLDHEKYLRRKALHPEAYKATYMRANHSPKRKLWLSQPTRLMKQYKTNAEVRGYSFSLSSDEFMLFWQKPCYYCDAQISTIGIDRVDNSLGYQIGNVVPCCKACNMAKRTLSQSDFFSMCKRIVLKHNLLGVL